MHKAWIIKNSSLQILGFVYTLTCQAMAQSESTNLRTKSSASFILTHKDINVNDLFGRFYSINF